MKKSNKKRRELERSIFNEINKELQMREDKGFKYLFLKMSININQQINEINYQDDLNRLAKKRNDEKLDECCDTFKMYLGIILILFTIVLCISLTVMIIINLKFI